MIAHALAAGSNTKKQDLQLLTPPPRTTVSRRPRTTDNVRTTRTPAAGSSTSLAAAKTDQAPHWGLLLESLQVIKLWSQKFQKNQTPWNKKRPKNAKPTPQAKPQKIAGRKTIKKSATTLTPKLPKPSKGRLSSVVTTTTALAPARCQQTRSSSSRKFYQERLSRAKTSFRQAFAKTSFRQARAKSRAQARLTNYKTRTATWTNRTWADIRPTQQRNFRGILQAKSGKLILKFQIQNRVIVVQINSRTLMTMWGRNLGNLMFKYPNWNTRWARN